MGDGPDTHHGTAIAVSGRAALILGPSGAGKSDLALRCLAVAPTALIPAAAQLVGDDRIVISLAAGRLRVAGAESIYGKLEVRGWGIVTVPCVASADLALLVELVGPGAVERLPDPLPTHSIMGVDVPVLRLAPFEAAAPVKVLLALSLATQSPGKAPET